MEENESSKGRYKTYSAEFKIAKIEEFMKSGKSEAAFCRDEGICLSTFRSWRSKSGLVKAETTVENMKKIISLLSMLQIEFKMRWGSSHFPKGKYPFL